MFKSCLILQVCWSHFSLIFTSPQNAPLQCYIQIIFSLIPRQEMRCIRKLSGKFLQFSQILFSSQKFCFIKDLYSHANFYTWHSLWSCTVMYFTCKYREPSCYICKSTITGANCRMAPFRQTTLNPMHMHMHIRKEDAGVAISSTALLLIETGLPACCLDMHEQSKNHIFLIKQA